MSPKAWQDIFSPRVHVPFSEPPVLLYHTQYVLRLAGSVQGPVQRALKCYRAARVVFSDEKLLHINVCLIAHAFDSTGFWRSFSMAMCSSV